MTQIFKLPYDELLDNSLVGMPASLMCGMMKWSEYGGVMPVYFRVFLLAILAFLVPSLLGIQKSVADTYRVYGVVSGDVLYIRAQPSSKSKRIGSIPPYGEGVEVLGPCHGSWCKVSYHGMTGWSSMNYLAREASSGALYHVRGIRSDDVLFIRAWPSPQSKKVGSIPPDGRGVSKLGPCKGNWCKINYRGIIGWSSMMYLVADGAVSPAPVYTAPPPNAPTSAPIYAEPAPRPVPVPGNRQQSGNWGGTVESIPDDDRF